MSRVYLVSKRFDPVLGVISGLWAYYLYENRAYRAPGHTLPELVQWKWNKRRELTKQGVVSDADGWKEIEEEVKRAEGTLKGK